ncbi:MAG TPA: vanadium-dependent haloperoxidase [Chitinophagaceae bacterium]|nr:vanadium-dependent haloperoxidase [Chitinophagaceae bacterium]
MKTAYAYAVCLLLVLALHSCNKTEVQGPLTKKYPSDVATAWIRLQMQLCKTTPGYTPGVTARIFGYSGLTMYESVVPGMPGYQSVALQLGAPLPAQSYNFKHAYYWPASLNGAMGALTRSFFPGTSAANKLSIDSLEAAFNSSFAQEAGSATLDRSADFGKQVAAAMFNWSTTDGAANDYLGLPTGYVPVTGEGLWVPTFPAFAPAAIPYGGNYRSFVKDIATKLLLPPPTPYSTSVKSAFYAMVSEIYNTSLSLTHDDSVTVRFWGDLPGQFNGPAHFTSVAAQLVEKAHLSLDDAAILYAKHGMAMNDGVITCFKTKYTYNLLRPITYIRTVLGYPNWNSVIPTPPHPEYPSAHAVIMKATAVVLEDAFGKNYSFTDNTFSSTYGPRHYASFKEYAEEGTGSRILGGLHFRPSGEAGLEQGQKLGEMINKIRFRK